MSNNYDQTITPDKQTSISFAITKTCKKDHIINSLVKFIYLFLSVKPLLREIWRLLQKTKLKSSLKRPASNAHIHIRTHARTHAHNHVYQMYQSKAHTQIIQLARSDKVSYNLRFSHDSVSYSLTLLHYLHVTSYCTTIRL